MQTSSHDQDSFAAGLVRDLADFQAVLSLREAVSELQAPEPEISRTDLRKLALLRSELLHASASVTLVASIANRLYYQPDKLVSVRSLTSFKPSLSQHGLLIMTQLSDNAAFFPLAQLWQKMSAHLNFANDLNSEVVRDARTHHDDDRSIDIVADAWQRVCHALVRVHTEVSATMASAGLTCDPSAEADALGMLKAAAKGAFPCIDGSGRIAILGWAERRSTARNTLDVAIHLQAGSQTTAARLINASAGGIGVEANVELPAQTRVTAVLPNGRELVGFVLWSEGGRLGIKLTRRLGDADPLLQPA